MLRSNATAEAPKGSTSVQAFRQLAGTGAGKRLFTGYTALVARNLPFTALQFPVFEHLRMRIGNLRDRGRAKGEIKGLLETGLVSGGSAGSAGALAAFLTTPSDVVKTRMMLTAGSEEEHKREGGKQKAKKDAWTVTREVYHQRGIRGFFRGGLFRSAWTALGSGLYLGTYDVAKVWLRHEKGDVPPRDV